MPPLRRCRGVTDDSQLPPKKREVPISVQQGRAARLVVAGFLPQVGPWQERIAKLLAIAGRSQNAEDRLRVVAEHRQLLDEVRAAMRQLETEIAAAPDEVKAHSRVADARRAGAIVLGKLQELETMLG